MNKNAILVSVIVAIIGLSLIAYAVVQHKYAVSSDRTFNLGEFGVALTVPYSLHDLSYTVTQDAAELGTVLHMHIKDTCEIGLFYQIQKDAVSKSGTPWTEETLEQYESPAGNTPARVKEFTGFYLVFEPSQEPCSSVTKTAEDETAKRLDLWNSLVTAHYITY